LACNVIEFDANVPGDFYVGSFDGEVMAANLIMPEGVDNPDFTRSISRPHCGPVVCLARSPYFPDILLSVGDWSFHLWRVGSLQPLFTAGYSSEKYTAAVWSPTREAVLFLGLADGSVQCWDLLDRSNEAALHANVCSTAICAMSFNTAAATDKAQLLAVGDEEGMLRINEVPSTLRRPMAGEHQLMSRFLETEMAKLAEIESRQVGLP
jgi:dynein intermediate chain 3, axonemal